MLGEFRFIFMIACGAGVALAIGFSFPALTESSSTGVVGEDEAATAVEERAFCKANLQDVDCRCFGQVAGHVRSDTTKKSFGFRYVDKTDLARDQAWEKC